MAQTILNRIANGDKPAVGECLDKFGGLVWSLARRMCANKDDAEDAVQEKNYTRSFLFFAGYFFMEIFFCFN